MPESFQVAALIPAEPERIYQAWMDSDEHGWMSGGEAHIDPRVGGRFTAWDAYISGTTLVLEPFRRIEQAWRTTDFPEGAPDSTLEVLLEPAEGGTMVTLNHSNLPDGQGDDYQHGWVENYFEPMRDYFSHLDASGG